MLVRSRGFIARASRRAASPRQGSPSEHSASSALGVVRERGLVRRRAEGTRGVLAAFAHTPRKSVAGRCSDGRGRCTPQRRLGSPASWLPSIERLAEPDPRRSNRAWRRWPRGSRRQGAAAPLAGRRGRRHCAPAAIRTLGSRARAHRAPRPRRFTACCLRRRSAGEAASHAGSRPVGSGVEADDTPQIEPASCADVLSRRRRCTV